MLRSRLISLVYFFLLCIPLPFFGSATCGLIAIFEGENFRCILDSDSSQKGRQAGGSMPFHQPLGVFPFCLLSFSLH